MSELNEQYPRLLTVVCECEGYALYVYPGNSPEPDKVDCPRGCGRSGRRPKTLEELLEYLDSKMGLNGCWVSRKGNNQYYAYCANYAPAVSATSRREAVAQLVVNVLRVGL